MILNPVASNINHAYERVEALFESVKGQRRIGTLLVIIFLGALAGIEAKRWGLLPPPLAELTPENHLEAIQLVFTVVLAFEVVSLLFCLVYSVSISVGKQVEILSLVLLRDIFKEISHLHEPIHWNGLAPLVVDISALAVGSLLMFVILNFYYRQTEARTYMNEERDTATFILIKKATALIMLLAFTHILAYNWWHSLFFGAENQTFESFYTLLIFCDIFIMLFAMRYGSSYRVAFRNCGYAVATLLIRIAMLTPPMYSAIIGVCCALFVLGIRLAYNRYIPSSYQRQREDRRQQHYYQERS